MKKITQSFYKGCRKIYASSVGVEKQMRPDCIQDPNIVADIVSKKLLDSSPAMIARFGSTELTCMVNYLGVSRSQKEILKYIKGEVPQWWWDDKIIDQMQRWSGFFPPSENNLEQFCELMLQDIDQLDVLGSWLPAESYFVKDTLDIPKVRLIYLDPFWAKNPWTLSLKGKKVLVVHPFATTIEHQYKKRENLFINGMLPEFQLKTIKAVQGLAGTETGFDNWFNALDYMKEEIDKIDFDICLIGAGAYGFPLAAHVKRIGKKGFHLGGSLQLLFGIRGKRWETPGYAAAVGLDYRSLVNKYWVKPSEEERPSKANMVEGACYW
ncbi:hypothetical protein [Sunxiuqinia indica]|uniref:hypothetical protein n=1 Tax=Sunxiuqinia indica TaxID=2692584 RepID=UPI0013597A77|nr:hypothetical protein [Sunxiuqinia indica]